MTEYLEILRLAGLGINHSKIAVGVGCSRQTVISVLKKAGQKSISYAEAKSMPEKELAAAINEGGFERARYRVPDFEHIHKELGKSGVTLSLLWIEYCEECKRTGEMPYQSTQFNKHYREYAMRTGATMHIERKPGESMEVDWAGGSVGVWDEATGTDLEAFVFVCVLSYSGYTYAEACWTMRMDDWLAAHVHAYEFFGGVARLLIPDNLKTGVDKNTRAETLVNKTYMEMADHYGAAVLPARIYRPNDKPGVEGAVKGVKTWILAAIRNEVFTSLFDLNAAIKVKIDEYNAKSFQKMPGSRLSRYLDEKPLLLPLPRRQYERSEWMVAKVQKDYHVKCGEKYYSVPFAYIGCTVNIRATRDMVEIFHEGQRICSHQRNATGKYVTEKDHMPIGHRKHCEWSGDRFRAWAGKIGPSTLRCIEYFLSSAKVEQQAYKTCNALLHLSDQYSPVRLENASTLALSFSPRPSYKAVSGILKAEKDLGVRKRLPEERMRDEDAEKHGFIRGAEYYGKKDGDESDE
ncbi:MAG: IS21 family transposase [Acidobacteriaceae bacterium]|nr:IS21 family transposase [Acidobacteriaceae bacterium]